MRTINVNYYLFIIIIKNLQCHHDAPIVSQQRYINVTSYQCDVMSKGRSFSLNFTVYSYVAQYNDIAFYGL